MEPDLDLHPIGTVESPLTDRTDAPRQPDEDAPPAWLVFDASVRDGLDGLEAGADMLLFTWLHQARRETLKVQPRGRKHLPPTGVFTTRSPDRPNPIGLHRVEVTAVHGLRVQVHGLEAIHGTPILDLKPLLPSRPDDR